MNKLSLAGLLGLAALGAKAQGVPLKTFTFSEPIVVTATRELVGLTPTLRDTIVITREELEDSGALSLPEVLQRLANVELRSNGGPGQPTGIFVRGASPEQTLVLIDGLRAGSATAGTTALEHIPLELVERIEIVKGPMSSLYGSDAMGGVIQIFTRGRDVPHLFGSASYGTNNDRRLSAGLTTVDGNASASLSLGARKVDAPSATNPLAGFLYSPDRDPYENGFVNARFAYKMWTGETIALDGFATRATTRYDGGNTGQDDRSNQTVEGVKLSSMNNFTGAWSSKLAIGTARDKLVYHGSFEGFFETRQDQGSWIHEIKTEAGSLVAGYEELHQQVKPATTTDDSGAPFTEFTRDTRRTRSIFGSYNEGWQNNRLEANVRRDDIQELGGHNTGSVSYGYSWGPILRFSVTGGRGFRAPTFNDLYAPAIFGGNPALKPERSKSQEITLAGQLSPIDWRVTGFDNRFNDLILYDAATNQVVNVASARVKGIEATIEAAWLGLKWRGTATFQRPRDQDTGKRLPSRADEFGSLDVSHDFSASWNAGIHVTASGARYDSDNEAAAARLAGYAVIDARVRYRFDPRLVFELTATNLADRHYQGALGYDAPRRGVMMNVRFDAF